jgi:hypothetical protein
MLVSASLFPGGSMKEPIQLSIIYFRGHRWYVDVRLEELRKADSWDITPLKFEEFEKQASEAEWEDLIEAILSYIQDRAKSEQEEIN